MGNATRETGGFVTNSRVGATVFRKVMGRFATGVTIITTQDGHRPHAMTANAVTSVSLEPPFVLVCVNRSARTHEAIQRTRAFCINILGRDQLYLSQRFAGRHREMQDPFADLELEQGLTGVPRLSRLHAYIECTLECCYDGGDHTIFLGRVVSLGLGNLDEPLIFHGGHYRALGEVLPVQK